MQKQSSHDVAVPLANYAAFRRAGDMVYFSGIIAADPTTGTLVSGYGDLPKEDRAEAGETGGMSVDFQEGPVAAQAWQIFSTLRGTVELAGGTLGDIVHLTQYFTDLRDFPIYSRVRDKFFASSPASTCLEVSGMLPSGTMRIEVQAVAHIPNVGP